MNRDQFRKIIALNDSENVHWMLKYNACNVLNTGLVFNSG